jgi:hypothetical protein
LREGANEGNEGEIIGRRKKCKRIGKVYEGRKLERWTYLGRKERAKALERERERQHNEER